VGTNEVERTHTVKKGPGVQGGKGTISIATAKKTEKRAKVPRMKGRAIATTTDTRGTHPRGCLYKEKERELKQKGGRSQKSKVIGGFLKRGREFTGLTLKKRCTGRRWTLCALREASDQEKGGS